MPLYALILFAHIVGVLGLFIALGLEWLIQRQLRGAATADQAREWLATYRGLPRLAGGSGALILLAGLYLAASSAGSAGWIAAGLLGLIAIAVIGIATTGPRLGALGRTLAKATGALSAADRARLNDQVLVLSLSTRALVALASVLVMTVKTDLVVSLVVLCVSVVLGLAAPLLVPRGRPAVELATPVD